MNMKNNQYQNQRQGGNQNNLPQNQQEKTTSLRNWIAKMSDQIKTALPKNITPERMTRIALTAISKDVKLASSTPESFLGALLTSAQLGLECNTPLGQAYLIPYFNGKKQLVETQFQLGYQGLLDLCYRTGQYKAIQARVVYEGDTFSYSYGLNEKLEHIPQNVTEKPIYVYAYYELTNGAKAFEVMSWEAVQNHAKKYSQSVQKGYTSPWTTDPESMAKKTVLKKVLKYAPKTVEVAESINTDSAIIRTNIVQDGNNTSYFNDLDFSPENVIDVKNDEKQPEQIQQPVNSNNTRQTQPVEFSNEEEMGADEAFEMQAQMAQGGIPDGIF